MDSYVQMSPRRKKHNLDLTSHEIPLTPASAQKSLALPLTQRQPRRDYNLAISPRPR